MNTFLKAVGSAVVIPAVVGFFVGCVSRTEVYLPFRPDMQAGTAFRIDAGNLHPTQFALGWREVVYKRQLLETKSDADALAYLRTKNIPIVIGPGGIPYMTDGHHTLRALLESSELNDKSAYGHVVANWSELDSATFWQKMRAKNYVYLKDGNGVGPQDPANLPTSLFAMQLDPYRGLGWGLMDAGAYAEKKDVLFQEFAWADYFRGKFSWDDHDDAAFNEVVRQASELAHQAGASALPGYSPTPIPKPTAQKPDPKQATSAARI